MANKTQTKAAIDAAVVIVKADIDNVLPAGVNITDGSMFFAPTRWYIVLTVADSAAAETLITGLTTNLTNAGRAFTVDRKRRNDGNDLAPPGSRNYTVTTTQATYKIIGF